MTNGTPSAAPRQDTLGNTDAPASFPFDLIAFDLDDTLLRPTHEMSARSLQALITLNARGVRVCLASGRMLRNMRKVIDALPFECSVVSFNGALVHTSLSHEPIFQSRVPAALSAKVIDWATERDLHLHFYAGERLLTNREDDWKAHVYREQTGAILEYESDFRRLRDQSPVKLLIADEPSRIESLLQEGRERFGHELFVTRSRPIYLEFLSPGVDKGQGLIQLCKYLQIPLSRVAAFGDAYNDTEMLAAVGYAVVMENGVQAAKALADEVCPSNEQDGVAQVLERWLAK